MKILSAVLAAIVFALHPAALHAEETRVKIGVIGPLTGVLAKLGASLRNSTKMADEKFDPENRVDFIFEDDGFDPKNSVSALKKLREADDVDAVMVFGSSTSLSVAEIAERAGIPMIAFALSDKITEGKKSVFRLFFTADTIAEEVKRELARRPYRTFAAVTAMQDGLLALRDSVFPDRKALVIDEEVLPAETDFRTLAARIKNAAPDAVLLSIFANQSAILAKQLRAIGYRGDFFSGPQIQIGPDVQSAQGALDGAWFGTSDDTGASEYYRRYRELHGEPPITDGSYAFDAAAMLIAASRHPEGMAAYLRSIKQFSGIFGTYGLGSKNTFTIPTTIKVIRGGEFVPHRK